jgi:hypothetical protein
MLGIKMIRLRRQLEKTKNSPENPVFPNKTIAYLEYMQSSDFEELKDI